MLLRYVILRHEQIDEPHFDLMFETAAGSALATWRSAVWPITQPTPLLRLGEHRPHYLTFEGPLSGNRGMVRRVDTGTVVYRSRETNSVEVVLQNDLRTISLKLNLAEVGKPQWVAVPFAEK